MKKRLVWLLTAVIALTPLISTEAIASSGKVVDSNQALEKIASEKAMLLTKNYGTVSVQYALIDHGEIKVSGQTGVNDKAGKIPLSKNTMYGIGSTSKMFTAAAVMKLVDEGKIHLDTPLVQYITDFKMKDERYKQITPRMLLNHSSGLQGTSLRNAFLFNDQDTYTHDTLLQQLSTQSLKADPGAFSVYCNDGFTLAEILVERVSGMDFTAFIHQYFTEPLEMNHTKTPQDVLEPGKLAALYYPTFEKQLPNETVNAIGAGGIYSTTEDLVRFSQIFTGQKGGILSNEAVRAMEQEEYKKGLWPQEADNSIDFGLGWDSVRLFPFTDYGLKGLSKGGDTILYHASLVVLPEQNMAAAVLSSGGSSSLNEMLASELLLQAMKEKGAIQDIKPEKSFGTPVKADMSNDVMKNAGYYGTLNQLVKVDIKDGVLSISVPSMPEYPGQRFVYTSEGTFVNQEGTTKVSFVTEKNGRTYLWHREYTAIPGLGQLALSQYLAEKLESNPISTATAEAWAKREGKTYYPVSEKFSSVMYMIMPTLKIPRADDLQGYLLDKKITGPNTAVSQHQIPTMGSRDTAEYRFYTKGGIEYLEAAGNLYVSEDIVKPLYAGKHSAVTVQAEGNARWYKVPSAAAGKKMTVATPAKGAFAVYDAQGKCISYTLISRNNKVVLPENGTIVFAGDAGTVFRITLEK
ncbi:CubicO group peptidase (beta-lactamase class C family) [Paenibacillus forsythiae]|uniref:CubicO group peptidase (Beta-lactamase class C family) n=1 Tax=Paenibacillus forsythiae TaxID=365616 RepID=A0ABU3H5W0_9BACL|nr:serine hydrolase domain-containing protein [Paenibacillus forsythiae]MDT3426208.1 CubicO group peptidase (beta-lactamase class C family) [Paenibacillus forsythiae]